MNIMTKRLMIAALALGLCTGALATEAREYAQLALCLPSAGKDTKVTTEIVTLVVQGPVIYHEGIALPAGTEVDAVNALLKAKQVAYIGVYVREGSSYGDVIRAMDTLRKTTAKNIGVSMLELPYGKEP